MFGLCACRGVFGIDGDPQLVVDATATIDTPPTLGCQNDEACTAPTPVCDLPTRTCVQCKAHDDCPSELCLPDRTCAAAAAIAYLSSSAGTPNSSCTLAVPCSSCTAALGTGRPYVKVLGAYAGECFVADREVAFFSGTVRNPTGRCFDLRSRTIVGFYDMTIAECANGGIFTDLGTAQITVVNTVLRDFEQYAIDVRGGELVMSRSRVLASRAGGMRAESTRVDITNSFFYRNGIASNLSGGVRIDNPLAGSRFEHNTVVHNTAGGGFGAGVTCFGNLTASNNIVAGNANDGMPMDSNQVTGSCNFTGSMIGASVEPYQFVSPDTMPYDYHLRAGSVAIDSSDSSTQTIDHDDDARPVGPRFDVGADEYR